MSPDEIKKHLFPSDTSLKIVMKSIGLNSEKVLFIVDAENYLIGSLTDGDIRRAILNGVGFECPVREFMHKQPRTVQLSDKQFRNTAKKIIKEEKLHAIPVIDSSQKIVDILAWYDFFDSPSSQKNKQISNPVVIMAGGQGTRLDPFTKILPKPLIPIEDQPLIEKIMNNFHKYGFKNFILTLNYKKELIKIYLRDNIFPFHIEWVEESKYLGTAGGLSLLKNKIHETFFVTNCDILVDADLTNILSWHKKEKALLTLVGCHREIVIPYGTIVMNEGILTSIHEKPKFDFVINTGLYVMEPDLLKWMSTDESIDMNHFIEKVRKLGKVTVYPISEGWFDLGQWSEYRESLHLLSKKNSGNA